MSTIALGDLSVNRLGFGAMRVLGPDIWGPPKDRKQAHAVFRRAIELGVDFFDTADAYGPNTDEELIAEALHPYPKGLVIGTKGGCVRPDRRWDANGRPEHLRGAVERSEEHTSELQSRQYLVCRLLLEKKKNKHTTTHKHPRETQISCKSRREYSRVLPKTELPLGSSRGSQTWSTYIID